MRKQTLSCYVLARDESLVELVSTYFEDTELIGAAEGLSSDVLVISDHEMSVDQLQQLDRDAFKHIFYMVSNQYEPEHLKNVSHICHSLDIAMIPPRQTDKDIVKRIYQTLYPEQSKQQRVVSFFSTTSNIGTTSVTLNTAYALKAGTDATIGVLLLNAWDDGTHVLKYQGNYLNHMKAKLNGQLLDRKQDFLKHFHTDDSQRLYILGGNQNTKMERLYTKEEIHYLIEKAKENFDITLIDAGCHFDNANIVQALTHSDIRFLIMNQQQKPRSRFHKIYKDILQPLGYEPTDFLLAINQYQHESYLPSEKEIREDLAIPFITSIPKSNYGVLAEIDRHLLYTYDEPKIQQGFHRLSRTIAKSYELPIEFAEQDDKMKSFLSIFKLAK